MGGEVPTHGCASGSRSCSPNDAPWILTWHPNVVAPFSWRCLGGYRVLHRLNHTPSLVNKYHYIWEKLLERKNFILFNTYELCKKLNSTEISTRNQIHFYRIVFRTKYLNIAVEYTNHFKIFTGNIFPESSCYRVIPRFSHRLLEPSSVTKPVNNSVQCFRICDNQSGTNRH